MNTLVWHLPTFCYLLLFYDQSARTIAHVVNRSTITNIGKTIVGFERKRLKEKDFLSANYQNSLCKLSYFESMKLGNEKIELQW